MIALDHLRPPPLGDQSAICYRDWLHLNVFDPATATVGLVNLSMHGPPDDPRARAVAVVLLQHPQLGWLGGTEVHPIADARIGRSSIAVPGAALAVHHDSGSVLAAGRAAGLDIDLRAEAVTDSIVVDRPGRLGSGWVGWYLVPRLRVTGRATIGAETIDFAGASAYHDHNWGRWHWGDDLGWVWGVFVGNTPDITVVLKATTDRAHERIDSPRVIVVGPSGRRSFNENQLELSWSGRFADPPRRWPGALAALHQDRRRPRLPAELTVRATDGVDWLEVTFRTRAAAQVILADPMTPGYAFLHELVGSFHAIGSIRRTPFTAAGLAIVERLE